MSTEQIPILEEIVEKPAETLDERIESLGEIDKKIVNVLEFAQEIIGSLDRDRQIAKTKMEDVFKNKYDKYLSDINAGISEQLTYLEQMCVGAEHQGSTFEAQQQTELARNRMTGLYGQLETLRTSCFPSEVKAQSPIDTNPSSDSDQKNKADFLKI